MKTGSTFVLIVNLDINMDYVNDVIFTIKCGNHKITKTEYEYNSEKKCFEIPFTQENTILLGGICYLEAQINFTDKSVAKSEIKKFFVNNTLATKIIDGNQATKERIEVNLNIDGNVIYGGNYILPIANPYELGGVMPVEKTEEMTQEVGVDESGKLFTAKSTGNIEIDSELSKTSTNPVENKVITEKLEEKLSKSGHAPNKILGTNAEGNVVTQEKREITVDKELSTESTNPVENRVVTQELNKKVNEENAEITKSISMGRKANTTIGENSTALGAGVTASALYSCAEGNNTTASGVSSHAEGAGTQASGSRSHAEGGETISKGYTAHAEGYRTRANGGYSHSEGEMTIASGDHQHVQGRYNIEDDENKYAHIVGGGTSGPYRKNIHTVDWDGNAWYQGSVSSNGADYAEFFEWEDGNINNEDRVGLLVTIDGEMIKLANTGDEILGIISATAAVLGDNYECNWNKKYLTDDFGRVLYDEVEEFIEIPKITTNEVENEETGEVEFVKTTEMETRSLGFFKHPRINPDYDPEQEYVNRANRKEWDTVGMLGKLYLRDDGTCEVNGYATAGEEGIATKLDKRTNIRVLARVNENVIKVFLK